MGIFSSRYRFHLNESDWWIRLAVTSVGLSYKVKIDGQLLLDERREQTSQELLTPQLLHVTHDNKDYRLEIGPVSAFGYGVHVYDQNRLVHRYKNRDFVTLRRHEKLFSQMDKYFGWMGKFIQEDTRPFWKTITEALIIGGSVGAIYAILSNWLETIGYTFLGRLDVWPAIIIGMVIIFMWPAKLRFIK
jgi:hypothetical protein